MTAGTPKDLSDQIDAVVYQLQSPSPRRLQTLLRGEQWVKSSAQIGNALRVMTDKYAEGVLEKIRTIAGNAGLTLDSSDKVAASLEDVFVAATVSRAEVSR